MTRFLTPAVALLAAAVTLAAHAQGSSDTVAFQTSVKVVIDAQGQPVEIEAAPTLSGGVRDFVEARARGLAFDPVVVDGQARGGVTYVVFGVCAVPDGEQMRLAAEYRTHGPGQADGSAYPAPPRYPVAAARQGLSADLMVRYLAQPDGSASLQAVEFAEGSKVRGRAMFERMARDWVAAMRVLPEEIDGAPVATAVAMPVNLEVANVGSRQAREMLERMHESQAGLAECLAAERAQAGQVANAQSAFVVRDAG